MPHARSTPSANARRPSARNVIRAHAVAFATFGALVQLAACSPALPESEEPGGQSVQHGQTAQHGQPGLAAEIDHVVDGDTVVARVDGRSVTIRLLGIDTPEKPGGPRPAECFGAEASAFAAELLPAGTTILLSRDHETRDQYGRLLAYVHRASDGLFVNLAMVQHGYATPLHFAPNTTHQGQFTQAANEARRTWIGFWPACGAADVVLSS